MSRSKKNFRPLGMMTSNASLPEVNPYTARARYDSLHRMHLERLGQVKPMVDSATPQAFPHVAANLKKQQMKNEAEAQIQYENALLLRKLQNIAQPRPMSVDLRYSTTPGIRLDRSMRPKIDTEKTMTLISVTPLRARQRQEEVARISQENLRLGRRLARQKGFYTSAEFQRTADRQEQYLDNCRKFRPVGFYSRSSTPSLEGYRRGSLTSGSRPGTTNALPTMPSLSSAPADVPPRDE